MESRLVLVIEGDDQIATHLAAAIREADYEVVVSTTASAGFAAAVEIRPDCIICDVDLPDADGYSVARDLRAHPSPVSLAPFLFLSAYDDAQARLEGFQVGGDVYITKPFRVEEVVAQVDALVQLASRLRRRRDSILSIPPESTYGTTAIEGDVRHMSVATVLSVLGMERRTGVFEVVSKKRRAQVEIVSGYVVHGTIGGTRVAAIQALRLMLSWKVGRFSFMPLPPCDLPPSLRTVQAVLLDAAKAEDEAAAGMPPSMRTTDAPLVTSIGGPPSRPDDTGPPSSRAMREAAAAPISLAFDLISSRRSDDLAAAPQASGAASITGLDLTWGTPSSGASRPAILPPTKRPADLARRAERAPSIEESTISVDLEDVDGAGGASVEASISVALETSISVNVEDSISVSIVEESFGARRSDGGKPAGADGSVSVSLDELEAELAASDRMLIEETPRAPHVAREAHRATPTPASGTPIVVRRTPAIMPPPGSGSKRVEPLPAPPAPPRPAPPVAPRPAPRTVRSTHRSSPKKG